MKRFGSIALLALALALAGCSSSDSDPTGVQLAQIEAQLAQIMPILATALQDLNPFNIPPSPTPELGVDCIDMSASCPDGGTLMRCPDGDNFDFQFDQCASTIAGIASGLIDGTLTYTPTDEWPSGAIVAEINATQLGNNRYALQLDGTTSALVDVTDLDSGFTASCTTMLVEPFATDCV